VSIDGRVHASIGPGLLVLLGVSKDDSPKDIDWLTAKIPQLRIFDDRAGRMNVSALDAGAAFLVVSQFTLYADVSRGRRPGFEHSAAPDVARKMYEQFIAGLSKSCPVVRSGVFGAMMVVSLENDGPVTIMLDTKETRT
jgi:D-tyrosyl-tRNA(Tyr) deacylase